MKLVIMFMLILGLPVNSGPIPQARDQEVAIAIEKLWSASDTDRQDGIKQIRRLAPASIKPLVALLSDLIRDQRPRFPAGREEDGKRVLETYLKAPSDDAADRVDELAINSRLMTDVINLLADLKAEAAVPVLIEILNKNSLATGPEASALLSIGGGAVSELIKDLDESQIRKYGFEVVTFGWSLDVDGLAVDDDVLSNEPPDPEEAAFESKRIQLIRRKVIRILGQIADPQSCAALEQMLRTTQDENLFQLTKLTITGRCENTPTVPKSLPTLQPSEARHH